MSAPRIHSRLPDVGTTIFTQMSEAADRAGALNLSQGFPTFDPPARLRDLVMHHIRAGHNQYAPMTGVAALKTAVAGLVDHRYRRTVDAVDEVTITAGATEALFCAIQATLGSGAEAVLLDPAYDSYAPAVRLTGATPRHVPMHYDKHAARYRVDWDRLTDAVNDRTRLVITNFPHNPSGALLTLADLDRLAALLRNSDAILLADEVYEHIVFDDSPFASVLSHAELWERSLVVSSFGKSLNATGWKVGYCVAPRPLSGELRKIHQFATFAVSTPMQYAIADYIGETPNFASALAAFYETKRDRFLEGLEQSRFRWTPADSTFFQLLDYRDIDERRDVDVALSWTRDPGVAAIPVSVFSRTASKDRVLRFCFARSDGMLDAAARRLAAL